jgi:hypothetical protein
LRHCSLHDTLQQEAEGVDLFTMTGGTDLE